MIPDGGLTFRGMDFCDACGQRLEPRQRLAGLCERCARWKPKRHIVVKHRRRKAKPELTQSSEEGT